MPRFGDYEIEALIGRGGMAEVYRAKFAWGPRVGQLLAVKRLIPEKSTDPTFRDLFIEEGRVCRALRHPNITEVFASGEINGIAFIAMEFVDGRDLSKVIQRCRDHGIFLPIDLCCFLGWAIAQGLHYAHSATSDAGEPLGIVHCDMNPSNVFVSRTGEVKVGDFGVARAGSKHGPEGGFFGKLHYLSPEQIQGQAVTPATDVYALGLTLYELITGVRAFGGDTPEALLRSIRKGNVQPASSLRRDVPPRIDELIARALDLKPQKRWKSAAEFADSLATLFDAQIGNPLSIASVIRGLFEARAARAATPVPVPQKVPTPAGPAQPRGGEKSPAPPMTPMVSLTPAPVPRTAGKGPVMELLSHLYRANGGGTLVVRSGSEERALNVRHGQLLSASSNVESERLGTFLTAEGTLPEEVSHVVASAAAAAGRRIGDQLVFEGLITPDQLAFALERQAIAVFRNAVKSAGIAELRPDKAINPVMHEKIGPLVMRAFLDGAVPLSHVTLPNYRVPFSRDTIMGLGLEPSEIRVALRLKDETPQAVAASGEIGERLVRGLLALGLLAF